MKNGKVTLTTSPLSLHGSKITLTVPLRNLTKTIGKFYVYNIG